jgi:molybdenum cofactor cytidylyltransferase
MFFGEVPRNEANGAILAHGEGAIKKGTVIQSHHDLPPHVTIARYEQGDIPENEAATLIASQLNGEGVRAEVAHTGRVNLFALYDGLLCFNPHDIHAVNDHDEAITLATLMPFSPVKAGDMLATVKIIPYGLPRFSLDIKPLYVKPFVRKSVVLIQTLRLGLEKAITKTERVTAGRLASYGAEITSHKIVPHSIEALSEALHIKADLIIIFGASAIADRRDVIPASLVKAGGRIEHLGMPVDPGNLLMLGFMGETPVIGAPGCARSPKQNGFDFVLNRLMAGVKMTSQDIKHLGVGGLIPEINTRPEPRNPA